MKKLYDSRFTLYSGVLTPSFVCGCKNIYILKIVNSICVIYSAGGRLVRLRLGGVLRSRIVGQAAYRHVRRVRARGGPHRARLRDPARVRAAPHAPAGHARRRPAGSRAGSARPPRGINVDESYVTHYRILFLKCFLILFCYLFYV